MSRRAAVIRGLAALLLVALAVVLGLASHDVLAWRGQTARANVAVARHSRDPGVWEPQTWLPVAVSRTLLGTSDDVRFGRALQRVQAVRGRQCGVERLGGVSRPIPCPQAGSSSYEPPRTELANLDLTFDNIARNTSSRSVRSRAEELHTLLLLQQLLLQGQNGSVDALTQAIAGLQSAVHTDPGNAEAAYDLEALLDLYRPIAVEEQTELPHHRGNRGDTGAAGGSPGLGAVGAGGF